MKRLNKKSVLLAALGLLIGSGAYLNYQMAKTDTTQMSDLTLANLEAMAEGLDDELDMGGGVSIPCGGEGTECLFSCMDAAGNIYTCRVKGMRNS